MQQTVLQRQSGWLLVASALRSSFVVKNDNGVTDPSSASDCGFNCHELLRIKCLVRSAVNVHDVNAVITNEQQYVAGYFDWNARLHDGSGFSQLCQSGRATESFRRNAVTVLGNRGSRI